MLAYPLVSDCLLDALSIGQITILWIAQKVLLVLAYPLVSDCLLDGTNPMDKSLSTWPQLFKGWIALSIG